VLPFDVVLVSAAAVRRRRTERRVNVELELPERQHPVAHFPRVRPLGDFQLAALTITGGEQLPNDTTVNRLSLSIAC
jgi:hypothetical protein